MEMAESRLLHQLGVPNPWKSAPRAVAAGARS
jgi:hypothetical protein